MANDIDDIRIKDLPLAEYGIQSNDYIAVDNKTDGTRKATMQDIVEANVNGLETEATNTKGAINELKQRMTADEDNITSLGTRISGAEIDILGLKSVDNTLSDDIANTYDTTATYSVGDYAMYQKKLYICVTDVATPEAFDSNKWQAVKVSDDISEINSALSVLYKPTNGSEILDNRAITGTSNVSYDVTTTHNGYISICFSTNAHDITFFLRARHGKFGQTFQGTVPAYYGDEPLFVLPCVAGQAFTILIRRASATGDLSIKVINYY